MAERIYADHAATTPLAPGVLETVMPYFTTNQENPHAAYLSAHSIHNALEQARIDMAELLGIYPDEIIFTSGATESISTFFQSFALAHPHAHLITYRAEHSAVLASAQFVERAGLASVHYMDVDHNGCADTEQLQSFLHELLKDERLCDEMRVGMLHHQRPGILISVMTANNEVGSINDIAKIAHMIRAVERCYDLEPYTICLHSDITQALGHIDCREIVQLVDAASASSHKFGGLKGAGITILKQHLPAYQMVCGGGQEFGLRGGTPHVAGAISTACALRYRLEHLGDEISYLITLANHLKDCLQEELSVPWIITGAPLNDLHLANLSNQGGTQNVSLSRLPGHVSIAIPGVEGHAVVEMLGQCGIEIASGSACSGHTDTLSHVLQACGLSDEVTRGGLRITLAPTNTVDEVERIARELGRVVHQLVRMDLCHVER